MLAKHDDEYNYIDTPKGTKISYSFNELKLIAIKPKRFQMSVQETFRPLCSLLEVTKSKFMTKKGILWKDTISNTCSGKTETFVADDVQVIKLDNIIKGVIQ